MTHPNEKPGLEPTPRLPDCAGWWSWRFHGSTGMVEVYQNNNEGRLLAVLWRDGQDECDSVDEWADLHGVEWGNKVEPSFGRPTPPIVGEVDEGVINRIRVNIVDLFSLELFNGLVAAYRSLASPAPVSLPEGCDGWVDVTERPPTAEDADSKGDVLFLRSNFWECLGKVSSGIPVDATKWKRTARAVLASPAPVSPQGWQPIESAPRDGTKILAFCKSGEFEPSYEVVYWEAIEDEWSAPGEWRNGWATFSEEYAVLNPLCWMPLPLVEPGAAG